MPNDRKPKKSLVAEWIEPDPHKPWEGDARIRGTGTHVWALIGYLPAVGNEPARVAADYELPLEAVKAAIAYYEKHRVAIDARLAMNDAYSSRHS